MTGSRRTSIFGVGIIALFALGSCSSTYDLKAVMADGHLTFEPVKTDIWGNPECAKWIEVIAIDGPLEGHGRIAWTRGSSNGGCDETFPISYGGHADDDPSLNSNGPYPLVPGLTYEVTARSPGSAYGGGLFVIEDDWQVRNLR